MSEKRQTERRMMGGGALVLLVVALPLWKEFREPGNTAWNVALAAFLLGLLVSALMLQRYFREHAGEIGEARFDTRNKTNG